MRQRVNSSLTGERGLVTGAARARSRVSRVTSRRLMPVAVAMRLTRRCGASWGWTADAASTQARLSVSSTVA